MPPHEKERRRDARVPLVLRVDYPETPQALRDVTENLSAGGLFIRTERDLREGDRLPLRIDFPGLLAPVEVEVEVVRRRASGAAGPVGAAVMVPADRTDDRRRLAAISGAERGSGAASRRTFHVLVVEDNPHVVAMYDHALRRLRGDDEADVVVEFASNGHDALGRLRLPPRIDLVLADLYMPVMDGFALIERMRSEPATAEVPVVVISAGASDARDRALALGIDVYLQKPVQFSDVIGTVRALLRIGA